MKKVQQGFTLIELMIVVAIIGILAAIAIPQYQTFIAKSQVSRVVGESGAIKTAYEDCLNNGQTVVPAVGTAAAAGECELGRTFSSILGAGDGTEGYAYTTAALTTDGTIVATFGGSASATLTATPDTITWTRDDDGGWTCASTAADKYNTAGCPKAAAVVPPA